VVTDAVDGRAAAQLSCRAPWEKAHRVVYVPNFRELDIRIDNFCMWLTQIMVGMYSEYVHTVTINI